MNYAFQQVLTDILSPFAALCALALFLLLLSPFWPRLRLWALAGRVMLFGLAMWPGLGLFPAMALDLLDGDQTALWMSIVVTLLTTLVALWGC